MGALCKLGQLFGHFPLQESRKLNPNRPVKKGNLLTHEAGESRQRFYLSALLSRIFHLILRIPVVGSCSSRHTSSQAKIQVKREGAFPVASKEVLGCTNSTHVPIS